MPDDHALEGFTRDITDKLLTLPRRAARNGLSPRVGGLARDIAGRMVQRAGEDEDPYAEAMRDLGMSNGGGPASGAPELTHPTLPARLAERSAPELIASGSATSGAAAAGSGTGQSGAGQQVDMDRLADAVYQLMKEDLAIEMERANRFSR